MKLLFDMKDKYCKIRNFKIVSLSEDRTTNIGRIIMAETIDELTIEHWEEGVLVLKVLEKYVLTKGAWATIMYLYQEMDRKTQKFKDPTARIVRYRKMKGVYRPQSKFNISSAKQALEISKTLESWFNKK